MGNSAANWSPAPGRVARMSGPAGQAAAGTQGIRAFRAEDLLADGEQQRELVAGPGRVARIYPVEAASSF
jgi:hypothetical protein